MAGRDLKFVKQTPSFIKNFKNQIGYKEPDNIESKFKKLEKSPADDEDDRDGEMPAVVLGTNVTEQEASEFLAKKQSEPDDEGNDDDNDVTQDNAQEGKFVFKKPKKRKSEDKPAEKDNKKGLKDKKRSKSSSKAVKNTNLLSFGNEEDEG